MLQTYTSTVHLTAKSNQEDNLHAALNALVASTRAEPGCLLYILHRSLDNSAEFFLYEAWVDKAAHQTHGKTKHIQQWQQQHESLVAEQTVKQWQVIKTPDLAAA